MSLDPALVLDHLRRLLLRRLAVVGFIALLSVVSVAMRQARLLDTVISAEHLHDIGKFLFAFTAFWAYIGFSQYFLIWYANLPEETDLVQGAARGLVDHGDGLPRGRPLRGRRSSS